MANPLSEQFIARFSEITEIVMDPASASEPAARAGAMMVMNFSAPLRPDWTGDVAGCGRGDWALNVGLREAVSSFPDPLERLKCELVLAATTVIALEKMQITKPDSWEEACGVGAEFLIRGIQKYEYSRWHAYLVSDANGDWIQDATMGQALVTHWGDITAFEDLTDRAFAHLRCIMEEPNQAVEVIARYSGPATWAILQAATGLDYGRDKLVSLMVDAGLTYATAEASVADHQIPWVRPLGDTTVTEHFGYYSPAERILWTAKMAWVLIAKDPGVSAETILADLPSVDATIEQLMCQRMQSCCHAIMGAPYNTFFAMACVCEKFGAYERALEYANAALSTDLARAGTTLPIARAQSSVLKGRMLASLGRTAEAAATLEAAADEAHQYGLRLHEAFALRDLKLLVLDSMGHGEHGSRRLGAVLRLLTGPAEKLTPLMKGLDVAELVALPPPDASYHVVYERASSPLVLPEGTPPRRQQQQQDVSAEPARRTKEAALVLELSGMRLKALKQRARGTGVDEEAIADTDDEDDTKGAVIALIVAAELGFGSRSSAAAAAAVGPTDSGSGSRAELEAMSLMALHKRAMGAGVDVMSDLKKCMDSAAPKAALVELLLALPPPQ